MIKQVILKSVILVKTGLRIGGNKDSIRIGGVDNPIIINPLTGYPYIPGSSIKGKMRFLLEWRFNKVQPNGDVHQCEDVNCCICSVFGSTKMEATEGLAPTRLIVRDSDLLDAMKDCALLTEEKTENVINRLKGKATSPRTIERVIPGTKFNFEAVIRLFDGDDSKRERFINTVLTGLYLLQQDYLGASGSRGYGKIAFLHPENCEREGVVLSIDEDGKRGLELRNYNV